MSGRLRRNHKIRASENDAPNHRPSFLSCAPIAACTIAASPFARGSLYIIPLHSGRNAASSGTMVPLVPSMAIARIPRAERPFAVSCAIQPVTASSAACAQMMGDCSHQRGVWAMFSDSNAADFAAIRSPVSFAMMHLTPCVPASTPINSIPISFLSAQIFLFSIIPDASNTVKQLDKILPNQV